MSLSGSRATRKMQDMSQSGRLCASPRVSAAPLADRDVSELNCLSWLARLVKFALDSCIGYPYYSPAYIGEHIDKPTTSQQELLHYKSTTEQTRPMIAIRLILFSMSLVFFTKSVTIPMVIFGELDLKNPETNLVWLANGTYRFGCLVSDCTRLGQPGQEQGHDGLSPLDLERLYQSLYELPYLTLCHPNLAKLCDPYLHFGPFGIMLASLLGAAAALGCPFSLMRYFYKADNVMLMFLVAPRVTRQVVKERAKQLLGKLQVSRRNYRTKFCAKHGHSHPGLEVSSARVASQVHYQQRELRTRTNRAKHWPPNLSVGPGVGAARLLAPLNGRATTSLYAAAGIEDLRERMEMLQELEEEELQRLDGQSELAAEDCVSTMRSAWWRTRAPRGVLLFTANTAFCIATLYTASLFVIFKYIPEKQARLKAIGSSAPNCSIWRVDNQIDPQPVMEAAEQIYLDQMHLERNLIRSSIYVTQFILALAAPWLFMAIFIITGEELTGWLCEVRFELLLCTEFVKQLVSSSSGQLGASTVPTDDDDDADHSSGSGSSFGLQHASSLASRCNMAHTRPQEFQHFNMNETIRSKFKPLADVSFFINDCKLMGNNCLPTSSRLESVQAVEMYVTERIVAGRLCLCSAAELLDKLHTSFRIFFDHVRCYDRTMTVTIVSANVYIYFIIIMDVMYIRTVRGSPTTPFTLLLVAWLFTNLIIVLASNFHAKANKLHTLIWSLIATTCRCPDIRIKHMRRLWVKQVRALDMDRGLSLKALGLRITYTNIIQLVVASGTIVVFALR